MDKHHLQLKEKPLNTAELKSSLLLTASWYGPYSPFFASKSSTEKCEYTFILFPLD